LDLAEQDGLVREVALSDGEENGKMVSSSHDDAPIDAMIFEIRLHAGSDVQGMDDGAVRKIEPLSGQRVAPGRRALGHRRVR
jgi:hypothetical protein